MLRLPCGLRVLADELDCAAAGFPPGNNANASAMCNRNFDPKGSPKLPKRRFLIHETGTSKIVTKVMRKNSNQTSSKLKQARIVVEGYISTCISGCIWYLCGRTRLGGIPDFQVCKKCKMCRKCDFFLRRKFRQIRLFKKLDTKLQEA